MTSVAELDLPDLPVTDPAFEADPVPYIEAARAEHPWLARCDFGYFERPNDFDPDRSHQNRHLGLGRGSHIGLGQHLARARMAEAVHQIARRVRKPRLTGEIAWRPFLGIWGLETLPIASSRLEPFAGLAAVPPAIYG